MDGKIHLFNVSLICSTKMNLVTIDFQQLLHFIINNNHTRYKQYIIKSLNDKLDLSLGCAH